MVSSTTKRQIPDAAAKMPDDTTSADSSTRCCIAGGGPAGMMLGYVLARAGVPVVVLEKHVDFLRDFRGDTVHPSTLQVLDELDLLQKFEQLPQRRVDHLGAHIRGRVQQVIDFRGLKPFPYLSLVPQWDFLDFLATEGRRYPPFDLRMRHEVIGLIEENDRVAGVRVNSPQGKTVIRAGLVVGCDGRHSTVRDQPACVHQAMGRRWTCCGFASRVRTVIRRIPSAS